MSENGGVEPLFLYVLSIKLFKFYLRDIIYKRMIVHVNVCVDMRGCRHTVRRCHEKGCRGIRIEQFVKKPERKL